MDLAAGGKKSDREAAWQEGRNRSAKGKCSRGEGFFYLKEERRGEGKENRAMKEIRQQAGPKRAMLYAATIPTTPATTRPASLHEMRQLLCHALSLPHSRRWRTRRSWPSVELSSGARAWPPAGW